MGLGFAEPEALAAAERVTYVPRPGAVPIAFLELTRDDGTSAVVLPGDPASIARLLRLIQRRPEARGRVCVADPGDLAAAHHRLGIGPQRGEASVRWLGGSGVTAMLGFLRDRCRGLVAERTLTGGQRVVFGLSAAALVVATAIAPRLVLDLAIVAAAAGFLALALLRAAAATACAGYAPPRLPLGDDALPVYTVLVPLLREARIVPRLVAGLKALDYPQDRLDVKLLVEAGDETTRLALERETAGTDFEVLVLPAVGPLTKPKALDAGLVLARGALITVYDAEDRPAPDQLRHAAEVFAADPGLSCLQARLAIDHADDCWLTRMFALEYAALFDRTLPWLAAYRLPFLLGGTSNHFRRDELIRLGGWDAWNVTEDADLAVRLARRGGRMTVIPSTTWEEAPLTLKAWIHQRSRWQKGWVQTWLVHMRDPGAFWRSAGPAAFTALQLQLLGALAAVAAHPFLCLLLAAYAFGWVGLDRGGGLIDDMRVSLMLYALAGGYAAAVALAVAGAARRGLAAGALFLATLPAYWLMAAASLALALHDLWRRPHHWAKTEHGLARRPRIGRRRAAPAIAAPAVSAAPVAPAAAVVLPAAAE